ncbi:MAG TPA: 50S ribosomal protein L28 [Thermomicrobiales bacterium]|nr:50S ribosomal protein L28 [Thermomicrobiales bacterium]
MAGTCALTGRKTTFGNNVSFSKRRTNRVYRANIQQHRIWVPELNRFVRLPLSAAGLRSIDKHGGLVAALKAHGKTLDDVL